MLALALAFAGCQDDVTTEFPPGLAPLDDDAVPATLDDAPTEELRTDAVDTDMIRVYGRGFVFAPPATVYSVEHDPAVMIAVCKTDTQMVTPGNEPDYELSFLVHYFVDNIVNVEWDDQWRGGVITGTIAAPELAMVRHQKVQGSDFINISEGTIEVFATPDPEVTELRFVEHLDATSASASDVIANMQHTYDAIVAVTHGGTIPACVR